MGGMAVGGFHAHADPLVEGRLQACGSVAPASQSASLGRWAPQSLIKVTGYERYQSAGIGSAER